MASAEATAACRQGMELAGVGMLCGQPRSHSILHYGFGMLYANAVGCIVSLLWLASVILVVMPRTSTTRFLEGERNGYQCGEGR